MQPIDHATFSTHQTHSNAGSAIKQCIYILNTGGIDAHEGYISDGPILAKLDLDNVTLSDACAVICDRANRIEGRSGVNEFTYEIDPALRVHFGTALDIAAWRLTNPVQAVIRCPYCLGAGCPKCDDTGKITVNA